MRRAALGRQQVAFSNAAAACGASTSTTCRSCSSNFPYPMLESTITLLTRSPSFVGTSSIDSTMSSVPSIWTANSTSWALGVSSERSVSATQPVMPSPTWVTSSSSCPSYSVKYSPRNAIGRSVLLSGCR